ncbi:hypothetical protein HYH03_005316 [Edaphochlamys debaryana]|uniref:Peptidase A1 domain-containing protein n=1 Tax=Edaphochlamys debaryana TaxID=47281 RepID=A0A835Y943_9CHLO|nr:hypothetical protein HYH03_005316 [Edaphochlamys debaryana]|eukprot:KAG2496491.1 hypothetical protein HYH03_005316 [Edaphochlamys debaryana]
MLLGLLLLLSIAGGRAALDGLATAQFVGQRPVQGGFLVPLRERDLPKTVARRHLLRSGFLPVLGAVREVGYFYTHLKLGTPSREFSVIIDTGSTITYIPCKGCAHCGKHTAEWFDPDASTSAKKLDCGDPLCNCGTPSCTCRDNRCYYSRSYAERSSSEGWMIEDAFVFPDNQPPVRMVFGCENGETGEIYRQMADGIMGMGNNHNAFQSQLVQRGVIDDVFSLCFGYPKDGLLLFGDVEMPENTKTIYTPLLSNLHLHYYNVRMESITVDGAKLALDAAMFDRGYGVVLDSGTTFTYLPTDAFNAMAKAVGAFAEGKGLTRCPGADPQYNDICWKGAPEGFKDLEKFFPSATFVFGEGAVLELPPVRYLFVSRPGEYCLGVFDNGGSGTLIGGVSVRDVTVTYDRKRGRVGFTPMPCAAVLKALEARAAANGGSVAVNASSVASTPEAKPAETPKPATTPEAKPAETAKPATTPETKPAETPKPATTPEAKDAETPKPATMPEAKDAETPKPATMPDAKPVETPKAATTPEAKPAETPKPATTPAGTPEATPKPADTKKPAVTPTPTTEQQPKPATTPAATPVPKSAITQPSQAEQPKLKGVLTPSSPKPKTPVVGAEDYDDYNGGGSYEQDENAPPMWAGLWSQKNHPGEYFDYEYEGPPPGASAVDIFVYHAHVLTRKVSNGYGTIITVIIFVIVAIIVAELLVFRRHKLRGWIVEARSWMRGDKQQDPQEGMGLLGPMKA